MSGLTLGLKITLNQISSNKKRTSIFRGREDETGNTALPAADQAFISPSSHHCCFGHPEGAERERQMREREFPRHVHHRLMCLDKPSFACRTAPVVTHTLTAASTCSQGTSRSDSLLLFSSSLLIFSFFACPREKLLVKTHRKIRRRRERE